MTHKIKMKNKQIVSFIKDKAFLITVLLLILLTVFKSDETKEYALAGMKLCYMNIIPTLFPFMIFSDILLSTSASSKSPFLKNDFFLPMLMGTLCGFPVGAICVNELYQCKKMKKEKAELLLPICTVPSLAFIVSGIGTGMLKSTKDGIILWLSVVASSVLLFILMPNNKSEKTEISNKITRQKFIFSTSVKNCGYTMLSICSFIIFFSVINGIVFSLIKAPIAPLLISAVLEVGNACFLISESVFLERYLKLLLLGFSLSFSGISVFMQVLSVTSGSGLSFKKYIFYKLLQSFICAAMLMLFLFIEAILI